MLRSHLHKTGLNYYITFYWPDLVGFKSGGSTGGPLYGWGDLDKSAEDVSFKLELIWTGNASRGKAKVLSYTKRLFASSNNCTA